ncbi:MAG: SHOCT domain-containing protein, partial [Clostridia bacterium]|nr:SHOCT domain-containing protein [Clostridia bacterium]
IAMPWAKRLKSYHYATISKIFIYLSAILCLLLIVSDIFIVNIFATNKEFADSIFQLNFMKWVLIFVVQFVIATNIVNTYLQFSKDKLPLQILSGISYIIFDLYGTTCIIAVSISSENGFHFNSSFVEFLFKQPMISILTIAIFIFVTTFVWFKAVRFRSKKMGINLDKRNPKYVESDKDYSNNGLSAEKKLLELNNMLDKNLITLDEYNQKRKDILDKM